MPCKSEKDMSKKQKIIKYKSLNKRRGLKKLSAFYKTALGAPAMSMPGGNLNTLGGAGSLQKPQQPAVAPPVPSTAPMQARPIMGSAVKSIKPIASR